MSLVSIKAAVASVLASNLGDAVKHVDTQYPRKSERSMADDFPKIVISTTGHAPESREAAGRAQVAGQPFQALGLKAVQWGIVVHLGDLLDDPLGQGDAFEALCDRIEEILRQHPTLDGRADTDVSKVMRAEGIEMNMLPPLRDSESIAYNCLITITVEEYVKA